MLVTANELVTKTKLFETRIFSLIIFLGYLSTPDYIYSCCLRRTAVARHQLREESVMSDNHSQLPSYDEGERDSDSFHREFVFSSKPYRSDLIVYTSYASLQEHVKGKATKFNAHDKVCIDTRDLQRRGFGIPLIESKNHRGFGDKHITIYRFLPPPITENRVFDSKIDKREFCKIRKTSRASYNKYVLEFQLEEAASPMTVIMLEHSRYPITDVTLWDSDHDVRYRWIRQTMPGITNTYKYLLNMLEHEQQSLVDDLEVNGDINPKNPLLGSRLKNVLLLNFTSDTARLDEFLGIECGMFTNSRTLTPGGLNFAAVFKYTDIPPYRTTGDHHHRDNIYSVSTDALIFLCMVTVFERFEVSRSSAQINALGNVNAFGAVSFI